MVARGALVVMLALAPGCVFATYDDRYDRTYGSATVSWTLVGRADPAACAEYQVDLVHVVVRADEGDHGVVSDDWVRCRELDARYVLRRGWYRATVTLADAGRAPLSSSRVSPSFFVTEGRDAAVSVDIAPDVLVPTATGDRS